MIKDLTRRLINEPDIIQFGIIFMAGHGMIKDGRQHLLLNEFDKRIEFYNLFPIEAHVRRITDKQNNSYLIVLVACCRENYNTRYHG